ncbi:hypothetical protein I8H84_04855 [Candidatus Saccharibacteria bacterium]|nr:hypothetical protein [Candidatus Saccharibacteria bacterium]MBH1973336.1 hypothetical protein [Candidatus Saccharibacteria bacterium]MBH1990423.1 hypothetical protein [Candidatus Saccharibacteria bacterium]
MGYFHVADKRQVKRNIRQLQRVKTWQLFVLLLLVGFIAATFLRLNNIGMDERRKAVLSADQEDNLEVTQARLYDLQRYVATHMNADMGTIYLEGQYKRDSQKIIDAQSDDTSPDSSVFKKVQDICRPRYQNLGSYSQAYQQCVISELDRFGPAEGPVTKIALPKADAYRHSFASPLWSPDFAGFSVLICLLILFVIVARMVGLVVLRLILKMNNREL